MTEPLTIGQKLVARWEGVDSGWSEPADLAQAIDEAIAAERERTAKLVERLREEWFHEGIPGDLAVPAGAFARSMKQLAAAIRAGER